MQTTEETLSELSQQFYKHTAFEKERWCAHERAIKQLEAASLRVDKQLLKLIRFSSLVGISALVLAAMFGVFFGMILNMSGISRAVQQFLDVM